MRRSLSSNIMNSLIESEQVPDKSHWLFIPADKVGLSYSIEGTDYDDNDFHSFLIGRSKNMEIYFDTEQGIYVATDDPELTRDQAAKIISNNKDKLARKIWQEIQIYGDMIEFNDVHGYQK